MPSTAPPRLLSITTVSERLGGLHEQTVRGLIRRRELGSVPVGRRRMVSEEQLAEYIERHTVDPAD